MLDEDSKRLFGFVGELILLYLRLLVVFEFKTVPICPILPILEDPIEEDAPAEFVI